ncbi:hypothetical protein BD289DRAFT_136707 [Coniella lustricola]|uniref:Secreted protein n=1 Tax=Coniella lustricola TaxID=2025994 RepID=A0A2T3AFJ6_9PEZI|nr:hypothetical protein BD289DRAFT_136707 [Coniella lustricola]
MAVLSYCFFFLFFYEWHHSSTRVNYKIKVICFPDACDMKKGPWIKKKDRPMTNDMISMIKSRPASLCLVQIRAWCEQASKGFTVH